MKKKEAVEPGKEGEESKEKTGFSTGAVIATALGVAATGWAVWKLMSNSKGAAVQKQ